MPAWLPSLQEGDPEHLLKQLPALGTSVGLGIGSSDAIAGNSDGEVVVSGVGTFVGLGIDSSDAAMDNLEGKAGFRDACEGSELVSGRLVFGPSELALEGGLPN